MQENKNIAEQNSQRMPHEQVFKPLGLRRLQILRPGHDGKGADVRAAELGIVFVVVVVGTAPDAAGTECPDAKDAHE